MSALSIRSHTSAIAELFRLLVRHSQLTWEMTKREITDRYVGQIAGSLWAIGHPLALMGVYIAVFALIFNMRMGGTVELPLDYTAYLLSGLIPWMSFQESLAKSSTSVLANSGLVKQVVFPLEVLPIKGVLASMVTQVVATIILTVYVLWASGSIPVMYLMIPVLFAFQFAAMAGASLLFAALGAYFRDLKDFVQVFCTAGMYFMPIVYVPAMVPAQIRPLLYLNPFSYMVWCYQDVCYFGRFEHAWAWPVFCIGSLVLFYCGYRVFRKLKPGFGSVL